MAIRFGSARSDERGKLSGGKAGDQTGREVMEQNFYVHSKGWYILRAKDENLRNGLAFCMAIACGNDHIGYDQSNRLGAYKNGITTNVDTETDCSGLVRACLKQCGHDVPNFTTANEVNVLMATGLFNKLAYTSSTVLYTGDILVTKTQGHTGIITQGNSVTVTPTPAPTPTGYSRTQFIKDVQSAIGVTVDGSAGPKTLAATPTISQKTNNKHKVVKPIQTYLNSIGFDCGTPDGSAGPKFTAAVKNYQRDVVKATAKNQDGVISAKGNTWKKLLGIS